MEQRMDLVKFVKDSLQFFKGCLPQVLFGPFLNTLTHIALHRMNMAVYRQKCIEKIYKRIMSG